MPKVHFVMQGKGGVGKSFIAALIAQYIQPGGGIAIDTDPVNKTLAGFVDIQARSIDIMQDDEINPRNFDAVIETILNNECDVVVDVGASSFVALNSYMKSNGIEKLILDSGREFFIHTVITGGQALLDTLAGFKSLASAASDGTQLIVWLNPYWGVIEFEGKDFEDTRAYKEYQKKVAGIAKIKRYKPETFGHDLAELLKRKETFDSFINDGTRQVMERQRIGIIKKDLYSTISALKVI